MSIDCTRAKAMRSMVSPPQEAAHNFMASNYTTTAAQQTEYRQSASESFYGYIQTITDAELLLAAYLAGCIRLASEMPIETSVRSGGVYIHRESGRKWMDGLNWSHPSSDRGFLVYRILEEVRPGDLNFRRTNALRNRKLPNACFCKRVISLTGTDGKRYTITSYFETKDVMYLSKEVNIQTPEFNDKEDTFEHHHNCKNLHPS
ncbi:hypothetical protein BDR26DRAFT_691621 [Obelidium mucronatum]|nr:hypothetical protein BDR26DRAFT_691621 [Obelidium mucronatum]